VRGTLFLTCSPVGRTLPTLRPLIVAYDDAAAWERTEVEVREQENQALREHPLFADCMQELERGSKSLHLLSQNDGRQKWVIFLPQFPSLSMTDAYAMGR
jgi:hypothetical protein